MPTATPGLWQWLWLFGAGALLLLLAVLALGHFTRMPGASYRGALEPLTPREQGIASHLRADVVALAGTIGERNLFRLEALNQAAAYISAQLAAAGYAVREQAFQAEGRTVKNLEATLPGSGPEIVIAGAHYDSVAGSPGANDNASGVAALLALARSMAGKRFARTVRFVAFVNEEPPWFQTSAMGSLVYAREAAARREPIVAMLSLETVGYYSDRMGSQSYPAPLNFFYPKTGNFIGFVGNLGSRDLVRRVTRVFREHSRFPSEGAAAPAALPGIGWSDHWAFWRHGFAAVMVTDTALFRYPQYHSPLDTPEIVDYERLARVVTGLESVVSDLAQ
jgi:Zn-dependent M28 family amino/carboxypeptidase